MIFGTYQLYFYASFAYYSMHFKHGVFANESLLSSFIINCDQAWKTRACEHTNIKTLFTYNFLFHYKHYGDVIFRGCLWAL